MPHLFYCLDLQPYTWTHLHRDPGPISSVLLACLGRNIQKNQDRGHTGKVSGLLLYAKTQEALTPDCRYDIDGNIIAAKTLDLNQEFSSIARQLDEAV